MEKIHSPQINESTKESGINWVGKIPSHWNVKPIKSASKIVLGKMLCPQNKGGYILRPYLKSKNIQWLKVDITSVEEMWFSPSELSSYRLKKGDLILSEGGEVGKTCIWNDDLDECYIQNSAHKVTMLKGNNPRYFLYQMYSCGKQGYFDSIVNRVSIAHLTRDKLSNVKFVFPPISEQLAIASFLDKKTAQIDEAIAIKEKQIDLLKERKQIIIQQAVTLGLNQNAPMKDSGVDWIGEIPDHWEMKKVKHIFNLVMEPSENNNNYELLSVYTDIGVKPRSELEERGNKASTTDGYWFVKKGDIVVNKLLAWMGAIGLSEYNGVTSPAYDILRPKVPINGWFYHLLFRAPFCSAELKRHSRGIMDMRLRLYFDRFGDIEVPYPPKEEQDQIIEELQNQLVKADSGIELFERQIEKLKEYKTTLINSAVTGKIKIA